MKDLIVTSISNNYSWNDLKNWIFSIKKTTYSGDILCVCYNYKGNEEILQKVKSYGIEVIIPNNTYMGELCDQFVFNSGHINKSNSHIAIHNVRFFHTWQYLVENQLEYNRVINTDIRDIVFQYNPSDWLDKNFTKNILGPCEEVLYKNQDWNINNSIRSFGPYVYEYILKENFVCNAGSFVTRFESFKNIAIIDYLMSNNTGVNADQAGFNILLNLFKNEVQIARMSDGWAFQAGGVKNPNDYYTFKDNIVVNKENNTPYCILHQYDRIPEIINVVEKNLE